MRDEIQDRSHMNQNTSPVIKSGVILAISCPPMKIGGPFLSFAHRIKRMSGIHSCYPDGNLDHKYRAWKALRTWMLFCEVE